MKYFLCIFLGLVIGGFAGKYFTESKLGKDFYVSAVISDVAEAYVFLQILADAEAGNYDLVETRLKAYLNSLRIMIDQCEAEEFCRNYPIDGYEELRAELTKYDMVNNP